MRHLNKSTAINKQKTQWPIDLFHNTSQLIYILMINADHIDWLKPKTWAAGMIYCVGRKIKKAVQPISNNFDNNMFSVALWFIFNHHNHK